MTVQVRKKAVGGRGWLCWCVYIYVYIYIYMRIQRELSQICNAYCYCWVFFAVKMSVPGGG